MNNKKQRVEEVRKLRERLLELGQPIIIPAGELPQPESAGDLASRDITIYPVVTSAE